MTKVWVIALSQFEWYENRHVCLSKETALKRFEEVRLEQIAENQNMVVWCAKHDSDPDPWMKNIEALKQLIPGKKLNVKYCDYPDMTEWEVET